MEEAAVTAHLWSSPIAAAASAAVEWILNVKLGSWQFWQMLCLVFSIGQPSA